MISFVDFATSTVVRIKNDFILNIWEYNQQPTDLV
jgi:hypothetical protein